MFEPRSTLFFDTNTLVPRMLIDPRDVDTGGCKPVCQSKEEHEAMVAIVDNLRRCGMIQPSRSQLAANIRMSKKNGQWRMCIDYRDLNKRMLRNDPYPLPRIDALLDTLGCGKVFCGLDLISGYHLARPQGGARKMSIFCAVLQTKCTHIC